MEYLICILAQHSLKWNEVSSFSPHAGHTGSSGIFITLRHLLSVTWLVRPTSIL